MKKGALYFFVMRKKTARGFQAGWGFVKFDLWWFLFFEPLG
jgi:hypothetical protein